MTPLHLSDLVAILDHVPNTIAVTEVRRVFLTANMPAFEERLLTTARQALANGLANSKLELLALEAVEIWAFYQAGRPATGGAKRHWRSQFRLKCEAFNKCLTKRIS